MHCVRARHPAVAAVSTASASKELTLVALLCLYLLMQCNSRYVSLATGCVSMPNCLPLIALSKEGQLPDILRHRSTTPIASQVSGVRIMLFVAVVAAFKVSVNSAATLLHIAMSSSTRPAGVSTYLIQILVIYVCSSVPASC